MSPRMSDAIRSGGEGADSDRPRQPGDTRHHERRRRSGRTPSLYRACDGISEGLIYLMVVLTPWFFGTTQPWAIWGMTLVAYVLGVLLLIKHGIRRFGGFAPARWGTGQARWHVRALALLTVLILGWCLASALNVRAVFLVDERALDYRESYLPWLPHSYDAPSTWMVLAQYLGFACAFWALRDWLLGKSRHERHHSTADTDQARASIGTWFVPGQSTVYVAPLPDRLQRLLWVLCLNGALLALEGILQRLDGTGKLLWLVEPRHNRTADAQFGPFAYRGNAAEYLNLLWPIALAFAVRLRQRWLSIPPPLRRIGGSADLVIVPCVALMAGAPLMMGGRAGALITVALLGVAAIVLVTASRRQHGHQYRLILASLFGALLIGGLVGWGPTLNRLAMGQMAYETSVREPIPEFTLHCLLDTPGTNGTVWSVLAGLSSSETAATGKPGAVQFAFTGRGSLATVFSGPSATPFTLYTPQVSREKGIRIALTLVKGDAYYVYVNGELFKKHALDERIPKLQSARFLWVGEAQAAADPNAHRCHEIALYPSALTAAQVQTLLRLPTVNTPDAAAPTVLATNVPAPLLRVDSAQMDRIGGFSAPSSGRREIYETAMQMARDFPWLGCGPGTFGPLYGMYRAVPSDGWAWYAHNDWLEFRITFGWIGSLLFLAAIPIVASRWFRPGGLELPGTFALLVGAALLGCLATAWVDFPFQIYSVTFLFLVGVVLMMSISKTE